MPEPIKQSADFRLREYVPADFETIWRLDQVCFTRGIAYSKQELAHYIKQPRAFTLLAERESQACGFIVIERDARQTGRVITIDVAPEVRRSGLGSMLMQAAEEKLTALGCSRVMLEVAVDNMPAIKFYRRHGYSIVKTIPRYYLGSLDALRMAKALTASTSSP